MILLLIILFVICCIGYFKHKSILSPIVLFNGIWFVTLLLYNLKMSEFQNDLSTRCILCIWLCIVGYNGAFIVSYILKNLKVKRIRFVNTKFTIRNKKINTKDKIKIVHFIVLLLFVVELIYSKGCPLIWLITGNSKNYFSFGIPSLNGALYGLVIVMGAYSLMKKDGWKFFYLAFGFLVISRQIIMSMVIEGLVIYLLRNKEKLNKKDKIVIAVVVVISLVFFGIYGNIRSGKTEFNAVFEAKQQYKNIPTTIKWIYAYMEFALNNFNQLVSITSGNINKGLSMLKDFLPTVLMNTIVDKPIYQPYYLVKINFNVSTYLPSIYLDFGLFGIVAFNFLIGLLGSYLFKRRFNSERDMIFYSVYVHNILLILFGNFFLNISVMVQFIYAAIIFSGFQKENKL